jgi:predicted phage tail protein
MNSNSPFGDVYDSGTTPANPTEQIMDNTQHTPYETSVPAETAGPVRHPARVGTIVWGAVVIALGILIIVASRTGLDLDPRLTAMWLLLGAGAAMVAGGAVKLLRRKAP